jgi:hypothetical protein
MIAGGREKDLSRVLLLRVIGGRPIASLYGMLSLEVRDGRSVGGSKESNWPFSKTMCVG